MRLAKHPLFVRLAMTLAGVSALAVAGCASADGTAAIALPGEDGGGPTVKVAGGHDARDGDDGASWLRWVQR